MANKLSQSVLESSYSKQPSDSGGVLTAFDGHLKQR